MIFTDAIKFLLKGHAIRREWWQPGECMKPNQPFYQFCRLDFEATDWRYQAFADGLVAEMTGTKWARDMETADIEAELAMLDRKIDAFRAAPDDETGHGGSPGEWMYERHEELTCELKKRKGSPHDAANHPEPPKE